jgi:hypothetical protein
LSDERNQDIALGKGVLDGRDEIGPRLDQVNVHEDGLFIEVRGHRVVETHRISAGVFAAVIDEDTLVNWTDGDVIIFPALNGEDAKAKFPHDWNAVKPYLRLTKQTNK